jgi:sarcosine oxidase
MEGGFDVLVVGLGVQGAAVLHELARRGVRVAGVDMHAAPHEYGSSNGRTRIIREAYFEDPLYVPLVQRAYELWHDLEELTGTVLYRRTGGVMAGPADGVLVTGTLASARAHGLEHELLDADALRRRFPALLPDADHVGVVEPRAGVLLAEPCSRTLLTLARGYGAQLSTGTRITSWHTDRGDVVLDGTGVQLRARQVVFAAGPWLNALLAGEQAASPLRLPLTVERQVPHWFAPAPGRNVFHAEVCPVTILEYEPGRFIYTLPDVGHGVKAGIHHEGAAVDPDAVDRTITDADERAVRAVLEQWMPGATERVVDASVCMYTNTPDGHFIVDRHPSHENVWLLSACSGHGFKFAPALGELVADLVLEGETWLDTRGFEIGRLT